MHMDTDLERLLAEIRRRRVEAEGRYTLAAESGYGWKPEGLRWVGAVDALSGLEEWAKARGFYRECDQGGPGGQAGRGA
jgi:hypothetical protein